MKFDVEADILCKASKCTHNRICQSVGGKPYCKISESVNNHVFFTQTSNPCGCPYQGAFGNAQLCTCPVRQEIYLKHKI